MDYIAYFDWYALRYNSSDVIYDVISLLAAMLKHVWEGKQTEKGSSFLVSFSPFLRGAVIAGWLACIIHALQFDTIKL